MLQTPCVGSLPSQPCQMKPTGCSTMLSPLTASLSKAPFAFSTSRSTLAPQSQSEAWLRAIGLARPRSTVRTPRGVAIRGSHTGGHVSSNAGWQAANVPSGRDRSSRLTASLFALLADGSVTCSTPNSCGLLPGTRWTRLTASSAVVETERGPRFLSELDQVLPLPRGSTLMAKPADQNVIGGREASK
jgi:hypothetical protein